MDKQTDSLRDARTHLKMLMTLLISPLQLVTEGTLRVDPVALVLQGDQAQMGKSKSLVFLDANIEWFEIFFLWKNNNWRFLYQNFRGLGQRFCLPHNFEPTASFHSKCKFCIVILWHIFFDLLSFLNGLSYKPGIGLKWKIIWCSFRKIFSSIFIWSIFTYSIHSKTKFWEKFSFTAVLCWIF